MMRWPGSSYVGLLVAMVLALTLGGPAGALGPDAGGSAASPNGSGSGSLLDALAFAPKGTYAFEFTDWTELKALHGGADITSESPLDERQRLIIDIASSEASAFDFGLKRAADWPELWGWDNTDLAWEAASLEPQHQTRVLRFRDDWDPKPFADRLTGLGYSRSENRHGVLFSDPPDNETGPAADAMLKTDELLLPPTPHSVAISSDGRTVVIRDGDRADELLSTAAQSGPADVATNPFGRVGSALGRPVTATIVDGGLGCDWAGIMDIDYSEEMIELAHSVGPLHPYQALGMGYERAAPGQPAMGRFAFVYEEETQAMADLNGRRALIDEGFSSRHGQRYRDSAFSLVDAATEGRLLVLDVAPLHDDPKVFRDLLIGRSLSFAACGS